MEQLFEESRKRHSPAMHLNPCDIQSPRPKSVSTRPRYLQFERVHQVTLKMTDGRRIPPRGVGLGDTRPRCLAGAVRGASGSRMARHRPMSC